MFSLSAIVSFLLEGLSCSGYKSFCCLCFLRPVGDTALSFRSVFCVRARARARLCVCVETYGW